MIESQYTANVHKRLPSSIYKWKINDNYAGGVPDAFYRCLDGGTPLWVEYKFIKKLPKRDLTQVKPNLSAQQLLWLTQAKEAGEQVVVVLGCEAVQENRNPVAVVLPLVREWEHGISKAEFLVRSEGYCYKGVADFITATCAKKTRELLVL